MIKYAKQYILYLLIVSIGVACGGQKDKDAAEFFGRGVYHFKKNELDDALRFFQEALKKNPDLADAHNNVGLIYEVRGKYEEAAAEFNSAAKIDPTFHQAKFNRGRILSYLGDFDNALGSFGEIEQYYKDSVNFYIERGQMFIGNQRMEDGIADFEKALIFDNQNSKALTNLGYAHILLNDFDAAEEKLSLAIQITPDEATAFNNLAFLYGITNEGPKALANATKAVKLEPTNKIFRNNLAYSLIINSKLDDAQAELEELKESLNLMSYFHRNMGVLNYKLGDFQSAEKELLLGEKLDPGTFLIYYYLGMNSLAQNKQDQAIKYFKMGSQLEDKLSSESLKKLVNS